jgi:GAF domain-containing protein
MIAPPIPADDARRLAELHALDPLDTPPEERFDRITRLLTLVLKVPMAFVTLVDADRQWFKSSCGLGIPGTPRSVSCCGHVILPDEALVVPDAAEDERFRDNPLVIGEPHIRFYAGQPLHGPGGQEVGTLCIADRRPRTPSGEELAVLGEMARLVERELGLVEVASLQRDLIDHQQRLLHELTQVAHPASRATGLSRTASQRCMVARQDHLGPCDRRSTSTTGFGTGEGQLLQVKQTRKCVDLSLGGGRVLLKMGKHPRPNPVKCR